MIKLRNDNKRNKKKQSKIITEIDFLSLEQELKRKNKRKGGKKKYDNKRF